MPQPPPEDRAGPSGGDGGRFLPVRVLFLAWGYSIHAVRRIGLFTEDPDFEVAVVSPHDYRFSRARNVLLTGEAERREIAGRIARERAVVRNRTSWSGRWVGRLAERSGDLRRLLPGLLRIGVVRPGTLRAAMGSQGVLIEEEIARRDLAILKSSVGEFRPDVIFLQTLLYPCYLANSLRSSIPVIVTFWNGDVTWWARWNGTERLIKKQIVSYAARRATAVTVNSESARGACLSYGVRPERIHLIRYPGVEPGRFAPSAREEARRSLGIEARRVVLCPRGVGGYLNGDVIVEAVPAVLARHPEVLFLFLSRPGEEEERKRLRSRAEALGVGERIRWEGHVPWEAMPAYYNAADVTVSISSQDSLPNCMLESMACGVPVVMGDIPAIREWISDGVDGFLVPVRDPGALSAAIGRIFADEGGMLAAVTNSARERVRREADGEMCAERIKDLVRRVAGRTGARP